MRADQLTHLADRLRTLADRLDTEGPAALQRAHDWLPGPTGGDTHTTGQLAELDQVLADHQLEDRAGQARAERIHHQLHHSLDTLDRETHRITTLLKILAAKHPPRAQPTPANAGDGWCRSCHRNGGHLEPVTLKTDGTRRYGDLCRFCGEWAAAHDGAHPPLPILRARHDGRRITQALVDRVLAGDA